MKAFILLFASCVSLALNAQDKFLYSHILITNDDGIEDADRLLALAKNVKTIANRVSIVVANSDRSGTSNHTTLGKNKSVLEVTCRYVDPEQAIAVYTLPANPADCVLIGLSGLFGNDRPDLVLSGINGGSNIGPGWFGSGTIGAVRTAALLGVKALALSGFEDDYESSFTIIPNWITQFISCGIMDLLGENDYITIGFPETDPALIKGVMLMEREIAFSYPEHLVFKKILGEDEHQPENKTVWSLQPTGSPYDPALRTDRYYVEQNYIIVTPMTINENQEKLMQIIKQKQGMIPGFK